MLDHGQDASCQLRGVLLGISDLFLLSQIYWMLSIDTHLSPLSSCSLYPFLQPFLLICLPYKFFMPIETKIGQSTQIQESCVMILPRNMLKQVEQDSVGSQMWYRAVILELGRKIRSLSLTSDTQWIWASLGCVRPWLKIKHQGHSDWVSRPLHKMELMLGSMNWAQISWLARW